MAARNCCVLMKALSYILHLNELMRLASSLFPPSSLMGRCSIGFLIASNETPAREVIDSHLDLDFERETRRQIGNAGDGEREDMEGPARKKENRIRRTSRRQVQKGTRMESKAEEIEKERERYQGGIRPF